MTDVATCFYCKRPPCPNCGATCKSEPFIYQGEVRGVCCQRFCTWEPSRNVPCSHERTSPPFAANRQPDNEQ